jgi:hypothetical protein
VERVTSLIGHNGGPSVAPGESWRRHCWGRARADLLPHLPLEVLRTRVRRAAELGLDYRTYASVRAASGHDVVAFLFSSNALRVMAPGTPLPPDRAARLAAIVRCGRVALAQGRLSPETLLALGGGLIDQAHPAPAPLATWRMGREAIRRALGGRHGDGVILVGDTTLESEWCAAGSLAAYLPAERFFPGG